ncbi:hypothetical protein HID58_029003 [Brassica napus]|uniref:Uncharacterized protein n=1 Tax=Brassica napus TaxID=3708 RepID=A0ABQ8CCS0_BRANA|nr:hypothetical protein HID58_029003 [Brassica napus]
MEQTSREPQLSRYRSSKPSRYEERDEEENRWGRHADRIVRSRDNYPRRSRYGGARAGPYVRPNERSWQVKQSQHVVVGKGQTDVGTGATSRSATSREIVPYEHLPDPVSRTEQISETLRSGDKPTSRKIASAIVTPSRMDHHMEENVTLRDRGEARALSFSSPGGTEPSNGDDAIIGALSDMENLDQPDGGMLEDGVDDDDLLALDLMDLDGHQSQHASLVDKRQMDNTNAKKSKKHGVKRNAPLGINHRKFEILRRGSPAKRSASTSSHAKGAGNSWTEEEHRMFLLGLQKLCKRSSSLSGMITDELETYLKQKAVPNREAEQQSSDVERTEHGSSAAAQEHDRDTSRLKKVEEAE